MSEPAEQANDPPQGEPALPPALPEVYQRELNAPGVITAELDDRRKRVRIGFDPAQISDGEVRAILDRLRPSLEHRFTKLPMRLEGRASEAAAVRLERKAERVPGVRCATASFSAGVMTVTFDRDVLAESRVVAAVRAAGAPVRALRHEAAKARGFLSGHWLELSGVCLTFLGMIAGWLLPHAGAPELASHTAFLIAYLAGGWFATRAALASLRQWTIDVDLLMLLAALGAAFIGQPMEGALLLFLFSLSNLLQGLATGRTRRAITSLMKLRPTRAVRRTEQGNESVDIEALHVGDVIIVHPGESIPIDGVVLEGSSSIDESTITGESIPVHKAAGQPVFAGTLNQTGGLDVRVTRLAQDSTIARLVRMVEEAQSEKATTQRFLDRFGQWYALAVILFTIALATVPVALGRIEFEPAFYRAITVLVVASPCALIISVPASILSAIGGAARRGVLFKGGAHLEQVARVDTVAMDKTGTLTEGRPRVTDVVPADEANASHDELLRLAAGVEARSEHPLARAIVRHAESLSIPVPEARDFQSVTGKGAGALIEGRRITVGNDRMLEGRRVSGADAVSDTLSQLQDEGKTAIVVSEVNEAAETATILGLIAVADVLRPEAPHVVRRLRELGVKRVVMLTGDHQRVAQAIAAQAGIDECYAELLPEDKVRVIRTLEDQGVVAMVGDGVNDAPALAAASVGIAMGAAGTDVAMETADVVLMSDSLSRVPFALAISRSARRVIQQNVTFAVAVVVVLVIAALGFYLPLPIGVVAHEGSTVLVVLNGLRLLAFRDRPSRPGVPAESRPVVPAASRPDAPAQRD